MRGTLFRREHAVSAAERHDADAAATRQLGIFGTGKQQADVDKLLDRVHANDTELLQDCVEYAVFADSRRRVRWREWRRT